MSRFSNTKLNKKSPIYDYMHRFFRNLMFDLKLTYVRVLEFQKLNFNRAKTILMSIKGPLVHWVKNVTSGLSGLLILGWRKTPLVKKLNNLIGRNIEKDSKRMKLTSKLIQIKLFEKVSILKTRIPLKGLAQWLCPIFNYMIFEVL